MECPAPGHKAGQRGARTQVQDCLTAVPPEPCDRQSVDEHPSAHMRGRPWQSLRPQDLWTCTLVS